MVEMTSGRRASKLHSCGDGQRGGGSARGRLRTGRRTVRREGEVDRERKGCKLSLHRLLKDQYLHTLTLSLLLTTTPTPRPSPPPSARTTVQHCPPGTSAYRAAGRFRIRAPPYLHFYFLARRRAMKETTDLEIPPGMSVSWTTFFVRLPRAIPTRTAPLFITIIIPNSFDQFERSQSAKKAGEKM